jgi:hypothetical protein
MSNQKSILALFSENEQKVSKLYGIYSEQDTKRKNFWKKISKEEVSHGEMLKKVESESKNVEQFIETPYSRSVIGYVSKFVDREIEKATKETIDSSEAIENALRLEQSMIEKKCFEMFSPKNVKVQRVMKKLNLETQKHIKMLEKELKKMK